MRYENEQILSKASFDNQPDAKKSIEILENRYETERQLMQAVTNGQTHKAEMFFVELTSVKPESRSDSLLRDMKNYTVILNTLLRKAAEAASVHPFYIDSISSQYATKIEQLTSPAACKATQKEMVRRYCMLVKNHSLKGYSLLIRKAITDIGYDLTADLSLRALAGRLNVNPSYLSTLFRRETGVTLTEYVNKKRIEHAIWLLNTTDLQIQEIAQHCGIPDVNYFTKTFKKLVGKTPKEYRS
ncbi:MAG: helix-turn-helix transcriptional regulator [Lachnospiraceae bacterium]